MQKKKKNSHFSLLEITPFVVYVKKFLHSDWLGEMQFSPEISEVVQQKGGKSVKKKLTNCLATLTVLPEYIYDPTQNENCRV